MTTIRVSFDIKRDVLEAITEIERARAPATGFGKIVALPTEGQLIDGHVELYGVSDYAVAELRKRFQFDVIR